MTGTNGLFTGTNLANNNQTTNDTFDSYLSNLCWNQIDGRYAAMASDLSMVVGAATLKDLGQTYRNTSVDRSALDRLMELTSGVRVSSHVPVPATNRQNGCDSMKNRGRPGGGLGMGVWDSMPAGPRGSPRPSAFGASSLRPADTGASDAPASGA